MPDELFLLKSPKYLKKLCEEIPERAVGSEGNRKATAFFREVLDSLSWKTEMPEFDAMDWVDGGASLMAGGNTFEVFVSPYAPGCSVTGELVSAMTPDELEKIDANDKILFLYGDIAKEQLMPKNFVFYNPDEHRRIVALLENSGAKAIISATERNSALAGGVYPFPLIEDGDFNVPSVYMTEEEGQKLLPYMGRSVSLVSKSERIPGKAYNVIGKKGEQRSERIVITAHIDAKKGTPGAIDNATGVTVLLLLAELLKDYEGKYGIELVAFNGEDYYAAPGQMNYIEANQGNFDSILLNINIDGAGYKEGPSAFSFFNLPKEIQQIVNDIIRINPHIVEGTQWAQGDHSIFIQFGRPAIAVSSKWFLDYIDDQDITHTPKDRLEITDPGKIADIALALTTLIQNL